jgi:transketolase
MVAADGPVYMQVTRDPSPVLFTSAYHFEIGRSVVLRTGSDVTLISTGPQTSRVYEAAGMLARQGIDAFVLHVPTVKPLDQEGIVDAARATGIVVVVEEQNVLGGLGGAIAEVLGDRYPVRVKRIGINDTYGESGLNEALLDKYGLSAVAVAQQVEGFLAQGREPLNGGPATSAVRRVDPK